MMYLQNSPMSFASTQMLGSNFFKEKSRLLDDNKRLWTMRWWSWGDLNPRPQALFGQIYMLSGLV